VGPTSHDAFSRHRRCGLLVPIRELLHMVSYATILVALLTNRQLEGWFVLVAGGLL
jgi:hypothetical protein